MSPHPWAPVPPPLAQRVRALGAKYPNYGVNTPEPYGQRPPASPAPPPTRQEIEDRQKLAEVMSRAVTLPAGYTLRAIPPRDLRPVLRRLLEASPITYRDGFPLCLHCGKATDSTGEHEDGCPWVEARREVEKDA